MKNNNSQSSQPVVLLVEPNPYHGEILPGFTYLFQKLGYKVHILMRKELARLDPFAIYPADKVPIIHAGTAQWMKEFLYKLPSETYEIIFYTTNVFWEKDKNNTSYLRYLKFMPRSKHGSLYMEHNLWSIKQDDSEQLYSLGRVFTLLEHSYNEGRTKMINPHYFGKTFEPPIKIDDVTTILLVGSSSYTPYSLDLLFNSLRDLKKLNIHIKVLITATDITIPKDLNGQLIVKGHLGFKDYYQIVQASKYLLTIFDLDSKNIEQIKYREGTSSGTVQLSLGFKKPVIMNEKFAKTYGFNNKNAITYQGAGLTECLIEAVKINKKSYNDKIDNLSKMANNIEKTSLKNLSEAIAHLKKSNDIDLLNILDTNSVEVLTTYERYNALRAENKQLEKELILRRAQVLDLDCKNSQIATDLAGLRSQLRVYKQSKTQNLSNILSNNNGVKSYLSLAPKSLLIKQANARQHSEFLKQVSEIKNSGFFDKEFYLSNNPDVEHSGMDAVEHYVRHGSEEGRQPSLDFDQDYYLSRYLDVRYSQMNPLLHYIRFGKSEGRTARLDIHTDLYETRPSIVFQLDSFDKGGLEEVVFMLAANPTINLKYKVYIFVTGSNQGYLAEKAEQKGLKVIGLEHNNYYLEFLIKKLNVKLCNLHYSIFGIGTYKKHNTKLVYTIHNNYIWANKDFVNERLLPYGVIDKFIPVSKQVGDFFSKKFYIPKKKLHVITNGIDVSTELVKPQHRATYGFKASDYLFINVASFTPAKFHVDTVVAFAKVVQQHPQARLILVGNILDGAYFNAINEIIDKYNIKKYITIIDYIPKEELLGLLEMADCFILASLTEGFSIASIEALYHNLPLILTDVGGARHLIDKNDVGIIVKNAYDDINSLTTDLVNSRFLDDSHLNNLNDLAHAMSEMLRNKDLWAKKAKIGKNKVKKRFLTEQVIDKYIREFDKCIYERQDFGSELTKIAKKINIAFFAPFPSPERITEGWMSRIRTIDSIIGNTGKIYINVSQDDKDPEIKKYSQNSWEVNVGINSTYYKQSVDIIIEKVNIAYAHTLHLAEFAIPWLGSNKIIVDFHGITPEEEVMMGRPYLASKYEEIEKKVLSDARVCVMVSYSMRDHYKNKYDIKTNKTIILPIVESINVYRKVFNHIPNTKYQTVYSGGTQEWQNVHDMLSLAKTTSKTVRTSFLSHDWEYLSKLGKEHNLPNETVYEFCNKKDLFSEYKKYDFGFVIRDDTPVNRVACPTKLYEYMTAGIIPIVRLQELGDFKRFGYKYITEDDYQNARLPDNDKMQRMINDNYEVVDKMKKTFNQGSADLMKEARC